MTRVHIANTDVEFEYAHSSLIPFEKSWSRHPLCLQLQFLPLLYAMPNDSVAVTAVPKDSYLKILKETGWWPDGLPHIVILEDSAKFQGLECLAWGPSLRVQDWAKRDKMSYAIPGDWQTTCLVNSKAFSFRYTSLSEAALLYNKQDLLSWVQNIKGPKVLKTCFGLSGIGNRLLNSSEPSSDLLAFCNKEWLHKRPIIGEPWLDRLVDFSSQWVIHPDQKIDWIGATRFETDIYGTYQGTFAGPEDILFGSLKKYLVEHQMFVRKALEDIATMGFFGNIGIDALLYRNPQSHMISLYPLVEINGRQTMSLVALRLQQRLCPNKILHLAFRSDLQSFPSLLPDECLNDKGKIISFRKHLTAKILTVY